MNTRIIDRLLQYLRHKKISAYAFERLCQVANGYLKKQEKGKGSIGSDILERIHRNYTDLSLLWLVTGAGEMLTGDRSSPANAMLREADVLYSKDEKIKALTERVAMLEASLADKEKIISLLEAQAKRNSA